MRTQLFLNAEPAILVSLLQHLKTTAALVDAGENADEEPVLFTTFDVPDEPYILALQISLSFTDDSERSLTIQIGEEDSELGTCKIEMISNINQPHELRESFEVQVDMPELTEEIGLQLALFAAEFFGDANGDLLLRELNDRVVQPIEELARTLPV